MSNRSVKNGMGLIKDSGIVLPGDNDLLLEVVVTKAGVRLKSPLPPNEVCKLLYSIGVDLMYQSFQPAEVPKIQSM
jgi:hypothetical protein